MIRHIVALRFREDVTQAKKDSLFAALDGLRERLNGMLAFQAFTNVSAERLLVRGFDDVFWCDFADIAARDVYLADLEHQSIGAALVAELDGGVEGIFVFDVAL